MQNCFFQVSEHYSGARTLMRQLYTIRQVNHWLLELEAIFEMGKISDLINHLVTGASSKGHLNGLTLPKPLKEELARMFQAHKNGSDDENRVWPPSDFEKLSLKGNIII